MARSQFTFTFHAAQPGAAVTFSAAVYSSPVDAQADGPTLALDLQRTVAVWTEGTELSATWVDGAGASITLEASVARPVVSTGLGKPGEAPTSAASGPLSTLLYGTGQDGAVVLADGDQINTGMYTDFTIPAGATVTPNINWAPAPSPLANSYYAIPVVFCTGTFTIGGTVDLRGVDAVDYNPLAQFVQGGHQAAGSADAMTGPYPGGHGGAGSAGAGDTMRLSRAMITPIRLLTALSGAEMGGSLYLEYENSGGGGAGDNTNYGGAGGVPGSGLVIVARHIVHADTNSYLLTGGKGADGGWDGAGGGPGLGDCGGGGGGGGGWWMTVCDDIVGSANLSGHGGAGGAGCGTGTAGGTGTDGQGIHYTPDGVIIQNPA